MFSPNPIYNGVDGRIYDTVPDLPLAKLSWSTMPDTAGQRPGHQDVAQERFELRPMQNGHQDHDQYITMTSSLERPATTRYTTAPMP